MLVACGGIWAGPCPGTPATAVHPSHPPNPPATAAGADQHKMVAGEQQGVADEREREACSARVSDAALLSQLCDPSSSYWAIPTATVRGCGRHKRGRVAKLAMQAASITCDGPLTAAGSV